MEKLKAHAKRVLEDPGDDQREVIQMSSVLNTF